LLSVARQVDFAPYLVLTVRNFPCLMFPLVWQGEWPSEFLCPKHSLLNSKLW
jgi:hypothetical protein